MKIAIITDTHAGMRNDNKFLRLKQEQFYQDIFFPYLDEHSIKMVFHLGDMFDRRKYINYETLHWWNKVFMDELESRDVKFHCVVGNHDCFYKSTNDINALNNLYGSSYDWAKFYWDAPVELKFGSTKIMLCPWLAPDNAELCMNAISNTDAQILMGHFEITGFPMTKGQLCEHGLDTELFSKFHIVYSGHFHTPSKNKNIHYLGTPYQMTWNDYGDLKGFHVFDTETLELEFVDNPHNSFIKLKYEDSDLTIDDIDQLDTSGLEDAFVKLIIINKTNPYLFDIFVEKLNNSKAAEVKIVDDNLNLDQLSNTDIIDEAESTELILQKFIESIDVSVDKMELQRFMQELYYESLNV